MLSENTIGQITAQTDLAEEDNRLVAVEFIKVLTQLIHIDIAGARDRAKPELVRRAHINQLQLIILCLQLCVQSSPVHHFVGLVEHVAGHITGNIDRVLGRAEGRGVGQFQLSQIVHRQPTMNGGSDDVYAFIGAIRTHCLCTEDIPLFGKQQLQTDLLGTGIIAGVRTAVGNAA